MNQLFDFGFVILVLLAFYSKPRFLYNLGASLLGRMLLLAIVILMAARDPMAGLAACLLYFDMSANIREGLTGSEESSSTSSPSPSPSSSPSATDTDSESPSPSPPASPSSSPPPPPPSPPSSSATPSASPSAPAPSVPAPSETANSESATSAMTPEAFRSANCSLDTNSLVTQDGKYVCLSDLKTVFPQVEFPSGTSLCDPCDPSCVFMISGAKDQMTVDHELKGMGKCKAQPLKKMPTTSGPMATIPSTCYDDMGALKESCSNPVTYQCPGGATVVQDPSKPAIECPCDGEVAANPETQPNSS